MSLATNPAPSLQTRFDAARFKHLLRASFCTGSAALEHFSAWNAQINWDDHLNTEEYRLLPQLQRNLSAQGFRHERLGKFKGIGRKAWYNNNLFFHRLAPGIREFRNAGIETILLYGGALALQYDNEYVLDYGADCGILVRGREMHNAFRLLERAGWSAIPAISERALEAYGNARYAHTFQNQNRDRVVLQWQLIPHCNQRDTDAEFWERAQEIKMNDVPARVLHPTDQLLHTCVPGPGARGGSRWQRMSDAMLLLRAASPEMEWEAFVARTRAQRVVVPVREVLTSLAQEFPARIPAPALEKIEKMPVSRDEVPAQRLWNATTPRERAAQLWHLAARRSCKATAFERAAAFPEFLQSWWGLESVADVPKRSVMALWRQNAGQS